MFCFLSLLEEMLTPIRAHYYGTYTLEWYGGPDQFTGNGHSLSHNMALNIFKRDKGRGWFCGASMVDIGVPELHLQQRVACVDVDISKYQNSVEVHTSPSKSGAYLLPRVLTNRQKQEGIVFLHGRNEICLVGHHSESSSHHNHGIWLELEIHLVFLT